VVIPNAGLGRGEKAKTDEGKAQRHAERIDRNRKAAEKSRAKARDEKRWQTDYIERLRGALRNGNVDQATLDGLVCEVFVWDESQYDATLAAQGNAPASSPDDQQSSDPAMLPTPELNTGHDRDARAFPPAEGARSRIGTGAQFYDISASPMVNTDGLAIDGREMAGLSYQTGLQNPSNFASNMTITGGHNVFYGSSANSNLAFDNFATNGSTISHAPSQRGPHTESSPARSYPSNGFAEHNLGYTSYEYPSDFSQSSFAELQSEPNPYLSGEAGGPNPYLASWAPKNPRVTQYASISASYNASGTTPFCNGPSHGARHQVLPIRMSPYADFENGQPSPEGPFMSEPPSYESEFPC
jgi:hypothetical protein